MPLTRQELNEILELGHESRGVEFNVIEPLCLGARVVCFGMTAGGPRAIRGLMRRFTAPFVTTLDGLDTPWEHVSARVTGFRHERRAARTVYLGTGRVSH